MVEKLFVEQLGDKTAVAFIPGLGYAGWCWEGQRELARDWRLVLIDNRGSGRSPKPDGPYSIATMTEDAAAVIVDHGLAPAHVVGHSLGGYLAMGLAVSRPELVRSVTLISTSPGGPSATPVPDATREAWLAKAGLPPAEYARATMHLSLAEGWVERHPAEYEHWLAARLQYPTPPEAWAAQYAAGDAHLTDGLDVTGIETPTLVIHGDADRIVPIAN
ncbi:MAG: alpha/beta fold hydrolase, partial [Acidimicrobiia bacterium]